MSTNPISAEGTPENITFRAIFRQLPERKLLVSANAPEFTVVELTDSYVGMLGVDRDSVVGKPYQEAFNTGSGDNTNIQRALHAVVKTKKPQIQQVFRHDLQDAQHPDMMLERYWQIALYPIFADDGRVSHVVQVSANATETVLAARELADARRHLDEALAIGKVGSWTWNIGSDIVTGDTGLARLFGLPMKQVLHGVSLGAFMDHVHPEDRERVGRAMQTSISQSVPFDIEFRLVPDRATVRWVIGRGKLLDCANGTQRLSGVTVDVTERRDLQMQIDLARRQDRLNREEARLLQQRNDELQELSQTKDEFVALASHQLRTPATAVKQYVGMVLQGYAGDISEMQRTMLEKAAESNDRQLDIIHQILNAARVDTGKLIMSYAPVDLGVLLGQIADDYRPVATAHSHALTVRLPSQSVVVEADYAYIRMAIENIVSNADKYTSEGGAIAVALTRQKTSAVITVRDTGVGIAEADLAKLFLKFSRVHNPLSVKAGGSGIGLYLAREIVRLHEGSIAVSSKVGVGTTFRVKIPLKMQGTLQK